MLDIGEYNTELDGYQGNGNGYDQLEGDWLTYYKVASKHVHKVKFEDREDFLHDAMLAMTRVKASYDAKGKELTIGGLMRVASYEVNDYWRKHYRLTNGIDCGRCSQKQRRKCKEGDLYSKCPKAVQIESLNKLVEDGEGDKTELYQMIADDNAIDIVAMLDAKFTLNGYPRQAVLIAYKRYSGYPLDNREQNYLSRFRKRLQKGLFE